VSRNVRYHCSFCGGFGHRQNYCPKNPEGRKRDRENVQSEKHLQSHPVLEMNRIRIQREVDLILKVERVYGHKKLDELSELALRQYREKHGLPEEEPEEGK
jgi:hypothetical protein